MSDPKPQVGTSAATESEIERFFKTVNTEIDRLSSVNNGFSILSSRCFGGQLGEVADDKPEPSNFSERLVDVAERLEKAVADNELNLLRLQNFI